MSFSCDACIFSYYNVSIRREKNARCQCRHSVTAITTTDSIISSHFMYLYIYFFSKILFPVSTCMALTTTTTWALFMLSLLHAIYWGDIGYNVKIKFALAKILRIASGGHTHNILFHSIYVENCAFRLLREFALSFSAAKKCLLSCLCVRVLSCETVEGKIKECKEEAMHIFSTTNNVCMLMCFTLPKRKENKKTKKKGMRSLSWTLRWQPKMSWLA